MFCYFCQSVIRELDWKWNSQDSNWHPYAVIAGHSLTCSATLETSHYFMMLSKPYYVYALSLSWAVRILKPSGYS